MKNIPAEAKFINWLKGDYKYSFIFPNYYFLKRWLRSLLEVMPPSLWMNGPLASIRQRLASLGWQKNTNYPSQGGQDRVVAELVYPNLKGGVFLEVGANDGIKFSNCFYLEKNLGWSGICVEPNPPMVEKLKLNRSAKIQACCVGPSHSTVEFPIESDNEKSLFIGLGKNAQKLIAVPQVPLKDLIEALNYPNPHFLSLDIEGGEYATLEALFHQAAKDSQLYPGCIAVEENIGPSKLDELLFTAGYKLIGRFWPDRVYWMPWIVEKLRKPIAS